MWVDIAYVLGGDLQGSRASLVKFWHWHFHMQADLRAGIFLSLLFCSKYAHLGIQSRGLDSHDFIVAVNAALLTTDNPDRNTDGTKQRRDLPISSCNGCCIPDGYTIFGRRHTRNALSLLIIDKIFDENLVNVLLDQGWLLSSSIIKQSPSTYLFCMVCIVRTIYTYMRVQLLERYRPARGISSSIAGRRSSLYNINSN